jgi:hypothetical protein
VFAGVINVRDIVDATEKRVNAAALQKSAINQNLSGCLFLANLNIFMDPKSNPHKMRAETKKKSSFAYFIF